MEEVFRTHRARLLKRMDFAQPSPAPSTSPVGETAARHQRMEIFRPVRLQQVTHMNVDGIKARTVEGRSHLNVGVDALLTQHGDFRRAPVVRTVQLMSSLMSKESFTFRP